MNSLIDPSHPAASALGFMLGGAEMLVILLIVLVLVVVVVAVVMTVVIATRRRDTPPPPDVQTTPEARLAKLDSMLAAGKITQAEHAEQRKRILDNL